MGSGVVSLILFGGLLVCVARMSRVPGARANDAIAAASGNATAPE
jgi:hypothetical protein